MIGKSSLVACRPGSPRQGCTDAAGGRGTSSRPGHQSVVSWSQEAEMLRRYLDAAMRHATYEILGDDGTYYGEIPQFDGVYANAKTLEECREELQQTLEDWLLVRIA